MRIGLQGNAQACMVLSEAALYALFTVWQGAGLGQAIAAKWVSGGNPKPKSGHRHGHGPQFFITTFQTFQMKYMMFATMGRMARHRRHYWRPAEQFRVAIGAQRMHMHIPIHIQLDRQQHPLLSVRWRSPTPLLKRSATGVQLCAGALLHTLHVTIVVGGVGKRPMVQRP